MARRKKKNPGVLGTTLIVLAVVGGLGYLVVQQGKKELQKGLKKAKETIKVNGWTTTLRGLGDGRYRASVRDPDGNLTKLGTFGSRDEALAAAQQFINEQQSGGSTQAPTGAQLPPGSVLMDQGALEGSHGHTEWWIYQAPAGDRSIFTLVFRTPSGKGMIGMLDSMAEAQSKLQTL
jgi:hypothetical protein